MSRQQPQEQADAARTIHSKENVDMQAAIQECEKCHDVCVSTMTHCLDQGSRHAEANHIKLGGGAVFRPVGGSSQESGMDDRASWTRYLAKDSAARKEALDLAWLVPLRFVTLQGETVVTRITLVFP